ncbi:MAG TPA: ferredoxin [Spirochaetota bacterium]|mgnify:CR=1 FL=1|nr:ferredoxin [Spirochaetota bacterium]HPS86681.1 ferredoxin [Spirochaetota bacterium]
MKAAVDKDLCIGCELCTQTCPEVFKMEDGTAVAYTNPVPPANEAAAKQAADECPVNCISIG